MIWPVRYNQIREANSSLSDNQFPGQAAETLKEATLKRFENPVVEVIAILSWFNGLWSREIQARHYELFPDVSRGYRIKRNILDRVLRDPEFQQLRQK